MLPGYFLRAVNNNVQTRNFSGGGTCRIFADHVERCLRLVRVRRDLKHDKAFDMRPGLDIQETEDQRAVHAFGLIGAQRVLLDDNLPRRLALGIGDDNFFDEHNLSIRLRIMDVDRRRVHTDDDVRVAAASWSRWRDPSAGELGSVFNKGRWQALRIGLTSNYRGQQRGAATRSARPPARSTGPAASGPPTPVPGPRPAARSPARRPLVRSRSGCGSSTRVCAG